MRRGFLLAALLGAAACHRSSPASPSAAPAAPAKAHKTGSGTGGGGDHRGQQQGGPPLAVVVNGKSVPAWSAAELAKVQTLSITNQNGETRDAWPLKALARALVGDKARVVAIESDDDRVPIDEKAWNDPKKTLVLHLSHRGEFKANWVQGGVADDALLKGVRQIDLQQ